MIEIPPKPTEPGLYSLRQVYRITERRDGAVYRTKHERYEWVKLGQRSTGDPDLQYGSLSTKDTRELLAANINTLCRIS